MGLRNWLSVLPLVCALALAACGGGDSNENSKVKILNRGNSAEPLTLNPQLANGTWENNIIGDMFIGLFTENAAGKPILGMAKDYHVSDDGLTWTFDLIDAKWSDGVPVTADDFVFAFQHILDPKTMAQYASILYPIKNAEKVNQGELPPSAVGVTALGPKKLEIKLDYPAPYLPGLLTHYTTYPIPKHVVEKWGDKWIRPEHIQVNGPYKLVEWRTNDFVHVKRNPLFYDNQHVCLDEIYYYPITDNNTAERQIREGRLDVNNDFPGKKLDFLNKELPGYVRVHPYLNTTYYSFNMTKKPFNDKRVRVALTMAVDRNFITQKILKSGQIPAFSMVPPGVNNYPKGAMEKWANWPLKKRMARAKELLEEAGFGPDHPLNFEFSYRSSGDNPIVAPAVQNSWNSIAPWVHASLQQVETQIFYDSLRSGDYEVGDGGWVADYDDAANFLYLNETRAGPMNYSRYSNPKYDKLMAEANQEMNMAKRANLMRQAEQIMLDDAPIAPMWYGVNKALVNPRVTGWVDNIVDIHRSRFLCFKQEMPESMKKQAHMK